MNIHRRHDLTELLVVFATCFIFILWSDAQSGTPPPVLAPVLPSVASPQEPITLLFAGDVMLGRHVGTLIERNGTTYPFEKVAPHLAALVPDVFMANLEGPITERNAPDTRVSAEQPYSMRFQFDPTVVESLRFAGFTHLSVANNHAFDQGREGADHTRVYLSAAGIVPVGFHLPADLPAEAFAQAGASACACSHADRSAQAGESSALGTVSTIILHGRTFAFVALDTTITAHDPEKLRDALAAIPQETFVTVFVHWGNEYERAHSPAQESFAHFLIDNGADLIIGSHPHVVQDIETYKNARIYYSLGNFVFDQYWNEDVQTGLLVLVTLDGDSVTYDQIPITSVRSQPSVTASHQI